VKDKGETLSRGYAFCIYSDPENMNLAMKSLNGHMIEGKPLILKLAGTPAPIDA
jgi:RNA recognition motif-containing protein